MDLKRLNHLVALADTRNFGRAARQCHLSQSAFSRSIQAAEEESGLLLFNRGAQEVSCTGAGMLVVERARRMLLEARCLERDIALYRERQIGDVAFGVGPYPAQTMVPHLLAEMRKRYSGVKLQVEVNNPDILAAHLRAETLDFYVADPRFVQAGTDIHIELVGRLEAGMYVRRGHPLTRGGPVAWPALMPYGVAAVQTAPVVLDGLRRLAGVPDGVAPLSVEFNDLHLLKRLAADTDTVIGCADVDVQSDPPAQRLVRLKMDPAAPMFAEVGIMSLQGRSYSPAVQFAVEFIRKLARELMPAQQARDG